VGLCGAVKGAGVCCYVVKGAGAFNCGLGLESICPGDPTRLLFQAQVPSVGRPALAAPLRPVAACAHGFQLAERSIWV